MFEMMTSVLAFMLSIAAIPNCNAALGMPIEEKAGISSDALPWMTENNYRVVLQCQAVDPDVVHRIAWAEFDFDGIDPLLFGFWNPDSVRVVEYDTETKMPIKYNEAGVEGNAYYVPAKIDE